jgi:hypothetical protein
MVWFEKATILAERLYARVLRLGTPPEKPGPKSTMHAVHGDPNGQLLGVRGDIAVDDETPAIWQKTGSPTELSLTGWVVIGGGSGTSNADLAYGLRIVGLNPLQQNGSVNTSVLLFSGAATPDYASLPLADWVVQTDSLTDGTSFQITLPGKYVASLSVPTNTAAPGQNVFSGITLDATGIILTTLACSLMGFQTSIQAGAFNADDSLPAEYSLGAPFSLTAEALAAGRGLLRFHATPGDRTQGTHVGAVLRRVGNATQ